MKKVKIGVFRTDDGLESTLREALKAADWERYVRGKVFVKPNLCSKNYIPGAVTNPQVLFHLVSLLRDRVDEVIVGESDGYNYCCDDALKMTGVKKLVEKAGGKTVNLSNDKTVKVQNPKTFLLRNFSLPKSWRFWPSWVSSFSTTFCVAIPAWSVPGIQSVAKFCILRKRIRIS